MTHGDYLTHNRLPLSQKNDDRLQWVAQYQLFLVLFSALMLQVNAAGETKDEKELLGWGLALVVIPGYLIMAYMVIDWDMLRETSQQLYDVSRAGIAKVQGLGLSKEAVRELCCRQIKPTTVLEISTNANTNNQQRAPTFYTLNPALHTTAVTTNNTTNTTT